MYVITGIWHAGADGYFSPASPWCFTDSQRYFEIGKNSGQMMVNAHVPGQNRVKLKNKLFVYSVIASIKQSITCTVSYSGCSFLYLSISLPQVILTLTTHTHDPTSENKRKRKKITLGITACFMPAEGAFLERVSSRGMLCHWYPSTQLHLYCSGTRPFLLDMLTSGCSLFFPVLSLLPPFAHFFFKPTNRKTGVRFIKWYTAW